MAQRTDQRALSSQRNAREQRLRAEITRALGIEESDIREWSTIFCPDCRRNIERFPRCAATGEHHLPPLFYALAPEQADGDMPLGMGPSVADALADLLWNLRAATLIHDLDAE